MTLDQGFYNLTAQGGAAAERAKRTCWPRNTEGFDPLRCAPTVLSPEPAPPEVEALWSGLRRSVARGVAEAAEAGAGLDAVDVAALVYDLASGHP